MMKDWMVEMLWIAWITKYTLNQDVRKVGLRQDRFVPNHDQKIGCDNK